MAKLSIFNGTKKNVSIPLTDGRAVHGSNGNGKQVYAPAVTESASTLLNEAQFRRMLCRERKRSERSRKHLLLMLIDGKGPKSKKTDALLEQIAVVLGASVRETDVAGWLETSAVFGVIFTEFGECEVSAAVKIIEAKMTAELQQAFRASLMADGVLVVSQHGFGSPESGGSTPGSDGVPDLKLSQKRKMCENKHCHICGVIDLLAQYMVVIVNKNN